MRRFALVLAFGAVSCGGGGQNVTVTTATYHLRFNIQVVHTIQGPRNLPIHRTQTGDRDYGAGTFDIRRGRRWVLAGNYLSVTELGPQGSSLDRTMFRFKRGGFPRGEVMLEGGASPNDIDIITHEPVIGGSGAYDRVSGELIERGGNIASAETLRLITVTLP